MENVDSSKEVWPRTVIILFFQVFQCLKMLYDLNPNKQKKDQDSGEKSLVGRVEDEPGVRARGLAQEVEGTIRGGELVHLQ